MGQALAPLRQNSTPFKTNSTKPRTPPLSPAHRSLTMGRSINPNPLGTRCQGKDGQDTCPFPGATCAMNRRGANGRIFWKKLCTGCAKPAQAPRAAPQPRAVPQPQLNAFGGHASTVSPTPTGRGHPGKRTKWTGAAREFEDETSEEAIAYRTRRNGGPTRWDGNSHARLDSTTTEDDPRMTSCSLPV